MYQTTTKHVPGTNIGFNYAWHEQWWHVAQGVALLRTGVISKKKFWRGIISQTIPLCGISHWYTFYHGIIGKGSISQIATSEHTASSSSVSHCMLMFFASGTLDFWFLDYFQLVARCIVHAYAWRSYTISSYNISSV